jgi:hypothetical protein
MAKHTLIHIGDTVRFLNESGEGRLKRFTSTEHVIVELPDGFEIPYPVSQLVVVKSDFQRDAIIPAVNITNEVSEHIKLLLCTETQVDTGGQYALVFYNASSFHAIFTYAIELNSHVQFQQSAEIGPYQRYHLCTKPRAFFEAVDLHAFQMLCYKKIEYKMHSPLTFKLSLKTPHWERLIWHTHEDFYKPVSLVWNFDFKSEMYVPKPDAEAAIVFSTSAPLNNAKQQLKHIRQPVIDLHFDALDAPQHLTEGHEKLRYQMDVFENELQKAFDAGCKSIIFIHGVGNGRLKSELANRLQQKLHISFHDASYKEYGAGATQVNLYRNGTNK